MNPIEKLQRATRRAEGYVELGLGKKAITVLDMLLNDDDFINQLYGANMSVARFNLGQLVVTPSILELPVSREQLTKLLRRHSNCDWGDLCEEDKALNDQAVMKGGRILSSYKITEEITIWIITEADRSVTTFLRPEDY